MILHQAGYATLRRLSLSLARSLLFPETAAAISYPWAQGIHRLASFEAGLGKFQVLVYSGCKRNNPALCNHTFQARLFLFRM